ncbi:MAG TPA: hypothetical protein VFF06_19945 [Polyangia bacterium]|nr:hypothetical protein [Polyangia bacterium]
MDVERGFFSPANALDVVRAVAALDGSARVDTPDGVLADGGGAWRHLESPCALVHPALAPAIAERLRKTEAELWKLVHEKGAGAIAKRLARARKLDGVPAAQLLIRRVPVPPLAARPLERMPGGRLMPGADNVRLLEVARRAQLARRLREIDGVGEALIAAADVALQESVEALCATFDAGPAAPLWEPAPEYRERLRPDGAPAPAQRGGWLDAPDPARAIGCAIGRDRIVLVFPWAVLAIARASGKVTQAAIATDLATRGLDAGEGRALFQRERLYVWNLASGEWESGYGDGFAFVAFVEEHELSYLVDAPHGRARRLSELADYPIIAAASGDGRFYWIEDKEGNGGAFESARAILVERSRDVVADARDQNDDDDDEEEEEDREASWSYSPQCAIALGPDDRFRRFFDGVYHDGARLHRIAPARAAAFARDARSLLIVDRERARCFTLDGAPAPGGEFSLAPLAAALAETPSLAEAAADARAAWSRRARSLVLPRA